MFAVQRALRRWRELPAPERGVLVEAALLLPVVHALQQALPFRTWRRLLSVEQVRSAPRSEPSARQIADAIERARRGVPGVYKCLPQAYAGHLLLHRHGYASVVQVGVSRDAKGAVEAHAWVEHEGKVLIGELPDLARFVPLPPLQV